MAHRHDFADYHDWSLLCWTAIILSTFEVYCCRILRSWNGDLHCDLAVAVHHHCFYRGMFLLIRLF